MKSELHTLRLDRSAGPVSRIESRSQSLAAIDPDHAVQNGRPVSNPTPQGSRVRDSGSNPVPGISRPLLHWFTWYSRRYLGRHFHSIRVSVTGMPPDLSGLPAVFFSNHASWWDPLLCLALKERFYPERRAFAPMDARMLGKYRFFERLGFFGVEQNSRRGAVQFLRTALSILEIPGSLLAMTPQNRFVDVRDRPIHFAGGLGHLAIRVERALFVPFAAEYVYWEERLPEILVRFGEPVKMEPEIRRAFNSKSWTKLFEERLTATQDALAVEAQRRNPADFQLVCRGDSGQGGLYDLWRSFKAKFRGETFRKEHGEK